jgi:putative ABC transport system permease protein
MAQDPGFRAERALAFQLALPRARYPSDTAVRLFYGRLDATLAALPGVRAGGAVSRLPLASPSMTVRLDVEGRPPAEPWRGQSVVGMRSVTPDYFRTMGVPVRRGRAPTAQDDAGALPVAVLNETAARRFFGDAPAVGRRVRFSWSRLGGAWHTVVGVVGDVRHEGLAAPPAPEAYVPHAQLPLATMHVVVRTTREPLAVAGDVRGAVRTLDAQLPLAELRTLEGVVAASVARPRFLATLLAVFAAVALGLAAIGVFGLLSYAVAQQTREIGVRLALGARPGRVVRLVVGRAFRLVLVGLALGAGAALALGRVLEGLLYGVRPADPVTLGGVVLVLGLTAALACALPARRAARVDPAVALRAE